MFYFSATNTLAKDGRIKIFNYGDMRRDFTYIDDIVEGMYRVMQGAPEKKNGEDGLPLRLMPSTTSAVVSQKACSITSARCKRSLSTPVCFPLITTSKDTASLSVCSPAMCL